MMNLDQVKAIVDQVAFLDRRFVVHERTEGFLLQLVYNDRCVETGRMEEQRSRKWYVSPFATETEVVETCWAAVQRSQLHVAGEHFLFAGRRVYSPHIELQARIDICDRGAFDKRPDERRHDAATDIVSVMRGRLRDIAQTLRDSTEGENHGPVNAEFYVDRAVEQLGAARARVAELEAQFVESRAVPQFKAGDRVVHVNGTVGQVRDDRSRRWVNIDDGDGAALWPEDEMRIAPVEPEWYPCGASEARERHAAGKRVKRDGPLGWYGYLLRGEPAFFEPAADQFCKHLLCATGGTGWLWAEPVQDALKEQAESGERS